MIDRQNIDMERDRWVEALEAVKDQLLRQDILDAAKTELQEPRENTKGIKLIDDRHVLNKLYHFNMHWKVRHLFPEGTRLSLNFYRHDAGLY